MFLLSKSHDISKLLQLGLTFSVKHQLRHFHPIIWQKNITSINLIMTTSKALIIVVHCLVTPLTESEILWPILLNCNNLDPLSLYDTLTNGCFCSHNWRQCTVKLKRTRMMIICWFTLLHIFPSNERTAYNRQVKVSRKREREKTTIQFHSCVEVTVKMT